MEVTECPKTKEELVEEYNSCDRKMLEASYSTVADTHAGADRLEEIRTFCRKMGYSKIGVAFCKGLRVHGEMLDESLSSDFEVRAVCCNVCGIKKEDIDVAFLESGEEPACNPIGQAAALNDFGPDIVVKCGFCLGHDIIFSKNIKAPCTTFIVKDRRYRHKTADILVNKHDK
ncbi:DUF1847 domain-containing protein [Candidatus Woesearchaeota archaeon]|nr:DUF1847 domain-containing protein [Candidatus Woesearchaeota archaeon]